MASRTLPDEGLKRTQHTHAAITAAAGTVGVLAAFAMLLEGRPHWLFCISLFLVFFVPIQLGVTVGFHRLMTHQSFETTPTLRAILSALGSMAGQGPVIFWVALHRMHHEFSDKEGDPHSPNLEPRALRGGLWHAYIGWITRHEVPNTLYYAKDLIADQSIRWVSRNYYYFVIAGLALPALIGGIWFGTLPGALEGLVWGGLVRMFVGHNMIWWITSFAHRIGKRDYRSGDLSTNNSWIAIPTLGEGWHNNHHAFPRAAILNFTGSQIDPSGMVIALLARLGLAQNVIIPSKEQMAARRLKNR